MAADLVELTPIRETATAEWEKLEDRIKKAFLDFLFLPLLKELELPRDKALANAPRTPLQVALGSGRVTYAKGAFRGTFGAAVSKELRALGAKWDRATSSYKLAAADLPYDTKAAISASEAKFLERLAAIDARLAKILPAEIADSIKASDLFSTALHKVEKDFAKTVGKIGIVPELSPEATRRIAAEYQESLVLPIKNFAEEQIAELRKAMRESVFSGNRHESMVDLIRDRYGVTQSKAKFLARQETKLLMAKYKETRYQDSGVTEYKWGCVAGSPLHPVRPAHKALEGQIFRWDNPPITTAPGEPVRRNNPQEDYNCRCFARPIVRFTKKEETG